MGAEREHEGDCSVGSDDKAKGELLEWVWRPILPGVRENYREKGRQDLGVREISFLYGGRGVGRLDWVLAMLL
jgi:hypothetical protein